MTKYIINLDNISTKEAFYDKLNNALPLPEYCGKNLDALHDVLGELPNDTEIFFLNFEKFNDQMSEYAEAFKNMILDLDGDRLKVDFK